VILRDVGRAEEVAQLGLPAVVVGHSRTEVRGLINVVTDSRSVGQQAARHYLMDGGLRHLGFCGLAESGIEVTPWSRQREESFFDIRSPCDGVSPRGVTSWRATDWSKRADRPPHGYGRNAATGRDSRPSRLPAGGYHT
jgi:hypothetical protein